MTGPPGGRVFPGRVDLHIPDVFGDPDFDVGVVMGAEDNGLSSVM